jgi:hypothetical protein
MNHSKEPWELEGILENFGREKTVIITNNMRQFPLIILQKNIDPEQRISNVKRIISCVNAMEGIEDPIMFRGLYEAIKHLELDQAINLKATLIKSLEIIKNLTGKNFLEDDLDDINRCLDDLKVISSDSIIKNLKQR